jgi:hypothetical protein
MFLVVDGITRLILSKHANHDLHFVGEGSTDVIRITL